VKSKDGPVTEEDLHARIDGQLAPERATAVEAYLAAHPKERDRWWQYAEQRQMLREAISAQSGRDIPARLRVFILP
jgi:anti-sigma factor RsiW